VNDTGRKEHESIGIEMTMAPFVIPNEVSLPAEVHSARRQGILTVHGEYQGFRI
jgi:hypothetical protein